MHRASPKLGRVDKELGAMGRPPAAAHTVKCLSDLSEQLTAEQGFLEDGRVAREVHEEERREFRRRLW